MQKNKMKPHFLAAVKDSVLDLAIYEDIGENPWTGEGVTAKLVKAAADTMGKFTSISVRINSPGGDAFEGVAVYNLLRSYGVPVAVYIDGIAASAASIIAMAGDLIEMGSNAMMMIHNAWGGCMGNAAEMRKMADTLDRVSEAIAKTYVDRTGNSAEDVKAMLDAETWMGADECLSKGFCTSIAKTTNKKAMAMAMRFKALAALRNVPEALKADAGGCSCDCEECMEGECAQCSHEGCTCDGCSCGMSAKAEHRIVIDSPDPYEVEQRVLQAVQQAIQHAKVEPEAAPDNNEFELRERQLRLMRARRS